MPHFSPRRRLPLLRALMGLMGTLAMAAWVGLMGMVAAQHAAAAQHVLGRSDTSASVVAVGASAPAGWLQACLFAGESDLLHATPGALVRSSAGTAPEAAVSSTPVEAQYPEAPLESETESPATGMGSIEAGDDLNDFDDFAYQLRVVFDDSAQLNREVERVASLGGRALSRLEDNRSDKPPRG